MGKTRKAIKQELGFFGQRVAKVNPFRSRPNSPSPSARNAASGTADGLDVRRAASVPPRRNSLAGAVEREYHPLESSGASGTRPCSMPPSQATILPIVINDGLVDEDGEISNLKENPGGQSPNQEWVSLSSRHYLN